MSRPGTGDETFPAVGGSRGKPPHLLLGKSEMNSKIEEIIKQALPIYLEVQTINETIDILYSKRRILEKKLNDVAKYAEKYAINTGEEFGDCLYRDGSNFYSVSLDFDEPPSFSFSLLELINFSPSHIVDEIDDDNENLTA